MDKPGWIYQTSRGRRAPYPNIFALYAELKFLLENNYFHIDENLDPLIEFIGEYENTGERQSIFAKVRLAYIFEELEDWKCQKEDIEEIELLVRLSNWVVANSSTWDFTEVRDSAYGKGLFARGDIPAGTEICIYGGKYYYEKDRAVFDSIEEGAYLVEINEDGLIGIDGEYGFSLVEQGRFANTNLGPDAVYDKEKVDSLNNAQYEPQLEDGKTVVYLVATRDIVAGEEILVNYGEVYWKSLKETASPPRKAPKIDTCIECETAPAKYTVGNYSGELDIGAMIKLAPK